MPRKQSGTRRPSPSERLQALYDQLPHLVCQQKCGAYCGIIPLSPLEAVLASLDLVHPASGRRIQTLVAVDDLLRRRRDGVE